MITVLIAAQSSRSLRSPSSIQRFFLRIQSPIVIVESGLPMASHPVLNGASKMHYRAKCDDPILVDSCRRCAGCVSTHRKRYFPKGTECTSRAIVAGRVLESILTRGNCTTVIIHIHLYDWTQLGTKHICDCVLEHHDRATREPTKYFVSILGDFNFREPGKPIIQVASLRMDCKEPKYSNLAKQLREAG